jgi:hypothetical protein
MLDPVPLSVLEQNFLKRMENFLQGKLPEPMNLEPPLNNANPNTKQ